MSQDVIIGAVSLAAHLLNGEPVILCGPSDHCVGGQGRAPRLFGLGFQVTGPECSFVGVDEVTFLSAWIDSPLLSRREILRR